ncbi:alpha/beta hydrolase [Streptomyces sp. SID3343]|uniref:alpha/beta hydrolase n=1 Tax=Streptomyces sp. SID3343 TaxID=2690260 RepID=UPI001371D941|nr:alpha/beta hydrolase [Streptomyces sp. SID3343]MYV97237.1 alpha/beta hydrolase [Streptomyces sp. SID3343]
MPHDHAPEPTRRTVARSAVLATTALLLAGGTVARAQPGRAQQAPTGGDVVPTLPAPTGPHRLGVTTLYLVDRSRRDPWEPAIPVREVMVTIFYPARTVRGFPVAPQMSRGAADTFTGFDPAVLHRELPMAGVNWAATATHAHTGAPAQPVRRPVLLYSPGGGDPRTMGTGLAEELASHGCVVVTIDHPGDAGEVEFPVEMEGRDGTVRPTVFRGNPRDNPQIFRTAMDTRITDTRFVLDRLHDLAAGRNPDALGIALPEHLGRALDLRRVGIYGHSAGGTVAAQTLYEDRRFGAAINLEGYLDQAPEAPGRDGDLYPVAAHGVDRPLLLLGTDGFADRNGLKRSWSAMLAHRPGHTTHRQLDHANHWVVTDYAAIAPQLQSADLMTPTNRNQLIGTIPPSTSIPLIRRHVRSFFTHNLPPH